MSFAEDYKEFQSWKMRLSDTPEAWEEHKALVRKTEHLDVVVELVSLHENKSANDLRQSLESYLVGRGYLDVDFNTLPF